MNEALATAQDDATHAARVAIEQYLGRELVIDELYLLNDAISGVIERLEPPYE